MSIFGLAFKNLKRNPLHTILKALGIGAATAVITLWGMLTGGFGDELERSATALDLGAAQIHHSRFVASPNLYDVVIHDKGLGEALRAKGFLSAPRLYGFALASAEESSVGVKVRGLAPELEKDVTRIHEHVATGTWFIETRASDKKLEAAVVVGHDLARTLQLNVGSELVLVGQAADGSLANDLFRVVGILRPVNAEFDRRTVILAEDRFRDFFAIADGFHEIALRPLNLTTSLDSSERRNILAVFADSASVTLRSWRELTPALARTLDMLRVTSLFSLFFTYLALGCLVVNSVMMMIYDRMREYGVMQALGTGPAAIFGLIVTECVWLALMAAVIATVLAAPVAWVWSTSGLDLSGYVERVAFGGVTIEPRILAKLGWRQILLPFTFLLLMMPLAAIYPAFRAARTPPLTALNRAD